ncbi:expressed unknown protein [Seminavis robusta]|uniref:Uncharacterized protein n=1 Tax=Seminavis robusta TaxID=568900 RepID=A0A9N8EJD0_9STRA|nr:expressed unknown protein [Seminavis robusta]|eukprot:Sro1193_g251231.1  (163) ;mRNA; f:29674-30162
MALTPISSSPRRSTIAASSSLIQVDFHEIGESVPVTVLPHMNILPRQTAARNQAAAPTAATATTVATAQTTGNTVDLNTSIESNSSSSTESRDLLAEDGENLSVSSESSEEVVIPAATTTARDVANTRATSKKRILATQFTSVLVRDGLVQEPLQSDAGAYY